MQNYLDIQHLLSKHELWITPLIWDANWLNLELIVLVSGRTFLLDFYSAKVFVPNITNEKFIQFIPKILSIKNYWCGCVMKNVAHCRMTKFLYAIRKVRSTAFPPCVTFGWGSSCSRNESKTGRHQINWLPQGLGHHPILSFGTFDMFP